MDMRETLKTTSTRIGLSATFKLVTVNDLFCYK